MKKAIRRASTALVSGAHLYRELAVSAWSLVHAVRPNAAD